MQKELEESEDPEPKCKGTHLAQHKVRSLKRSPVSQRPSKQLFGIVAEALGLDDSAFTPSATFESLGR